MILLWLSGAGRQHGSGRLQPRRPGVRLLSSAAVQKRLVVLALIGMTRLFALASPSNT